MRASIAERSTRKELPVASATWASRQQQARLRRLKILRDFGDCPKSRRISVGLNASSLTIGFFHGYDSSITFLQYAGIVSLARFLLT
jgi:hypothetical protein